jgi:hypothetical protein
MKNPNEWVALKKIKVKYTTLRGFEPYELHYKMSDSSDKIYLVIRKEG